VGGDHEVVEVHVIVLELIGEQPVEGLQVVVALIRYICLLVGDLASSGVLSLNKVDNVEVKVGVADVGFART